MRRSISLCVVLTPLVEWMMLKRRPGWIEWAAVALSLLGAWLLAGDGAVVLNPGDALILLMALLRTLNVCVTKRVLRDSALPPLSVTTVQPGVVAFGSAAVALVFTPQQWQHVPSLAGHMPFWASVFYLIFACTLFAFFAQNYAIRRSSPTRVWCVVGLVLAGREDIAYYMGRRQVDCCGVHAGTVRWCKAVIVGVPRASEVVP